MAVQSKKILEVGFNQIVCDLAFNSRLEYDLDDLIDYIAENGVPGVLTVFKEDDKYHLLDGFRRYMATKSLIERGVLTSDIQFQCVLETSKSPIDRLIHQEVLNKTKPLTDLEFGLLCRKLRNYGLSVPEIQKRFGYKTRLRIDQCLLLVEHLPDMQKLVQDGKIRLSTVVALSAVTDNVETALELVNIALEENGNEKVTTNQVLDTVIQKAEELDKNVNIERAIKMRSNRGGKPSAVLSKMETRASAVLSKMETQASTETIESEKPIVKVPKLDKISALRDIVINTEIYSNISVLENIEPEQVVVVFNKDGYEQFIQLLGV
jgi:hypothetical protein